MKVTKTTAIAPSNIAFIKYWGKKDEKLRLPRNGSIAVNLSNLKTTTTIEFSNTYLNDRVQIIDKKNDIVKFVKTERIVKHIDRIRKMAGIKLKAKVLSKNNFPTGAGLASSASGFAALSAAGTQAAGLKLSEKRLSALARQGSGSACRSIPDGFVEWLEGNSSNASYAYSISPPDYWNISIIVVLFKEEEKEVSSTIGHQLAETNPFLEARLTRIKEKIGELKKNLIEKDFKGFGEIVESEALELHVVALTSKPSIIYWYPETVKIMRLVRQWRKEGLESYFTIDAGPHPYIICKNKDVKTISSRLRKIPEVRDIIVNKPAKGARLSDKHLF